MTKLSDFKNDVPYANEERKQQLIADAEPFFVLAITLDVNGQYGPRWQLTCEPFEGPPFRMALSATGSHNEMFERAAETVSSTDPLGPVALIEVPTKAGRKFRTIEDVG